mgnify:CR=1 FL=1
MQDASLAHLDELERQLVAATVVLSRAVVRIAVAVAIAEESTDEVEDARRTEAAIQRTKRSWFGRLTSVFRGAQVDEALWEQLEEILIGE